MPADLPTRVAQAWREEMARYIVSSRGPNGPDYVWSYPEKLDDSPLYICDGGTFGSKILTAQEWIERRCAAAALRTVAEALREPASAGMCRATVDESGLIATLPADVWERMVAAWLREQGVSDA